MKISRGYGGFILRPEDGEERAIIDDNLGANMVVHARLQQGQSSGPDGYYLMVVVPPLNSDQVPGGEHKAIVEREPR